MRRTPGLDRSNEARISFVRQWLDGDSLHSPSSVIYRCRDHSRDQQGVESLESLKHAVAETTLILRLANSIHLKFLSFCTRQWLSADDVNLPGILGEERAGSKGLAEEG